MAIRTHVLRIPNGSQEDDSICIIQWTNGEGASARLVDVLVRVKADITAIQEMRRTGQGKKDIGPCDVYYSCHVKERKFGVRFFVGERLRRQVLSFTPVDERLAIIRIKARFFNIPLICAHTPSEEKDDAIKEYSENSACTTKHPVTDRG